MAYKPLRAVALDIKAELQKWATEAGTIKDSAGGVALKTKINTYITSTLESSYGLGGHVSKDGKIY